MRRIGGLAAAAAVLLALTGCGQPEDGGLKATGPAECVRMVTNSGGLEDRSFNQSSWEGLQQAEDEFGVDAEALVSTAETDLEPNVRQAVDSGCGLVVTVGWELAEATLEHAAENPEVSFAIVDEVVEADNVKPVVFDTAQAAFLAGYLAAGVSKTGIVATFGGGNQPPVTLFMDGFADGVDAYNEAHGAAVKLLGWSKEKQDGAFTGDFEDINKGRVTAEGLLDQGADVVMPVAGQVGEGAAAAVAERGGSASLIWVDNDGYETLPAEYRPTLLTSVMKKTQDAMVEIVGEVLGGGFDAEPYIGTLDNGGVDIAPYHERESLVPAELDAEIQALRERIVSGDLVVESPSTPGA
ncbi:BMP family ABC transporter substrate-binding protein [Agromyces archimandritae]|uniref:BMP family ABC transporter substrate-binding protein n=2 Tax=Agromyces archimandritae TaxID=2781962 RepID=A0A975IQ01_9MICO|nr:BMP family ABC transporter substrate-binding protein [Agromyces archimandritae]